MECMGEVSYDKRSGLSKADLRELEVTSDPDLSADEKQFTVTGRGNENTATVFSEIPVIIQWLLSIPSSDVLEYRLYEGDLVALKAEVPKGHFRFKPKRRKSDTNGSMVGYGDYA